MKSDALLDYSKGIRFCLEIVDLNERLTQKGDDQIPGLVLERLEIQTLSEETSRV